ncbi:hypothetical protein PR202_ga02043 [Eleusine coracana subsp. coracana]|uniref:F-box domain-containing protein n=1 Tax=Eleusine coracana subsp. coracana TaxID=191504 RepID=A0AAV5BKB1_ELECO|nr:hypothetical protein PR202_ga01356 [Eleusine coracana subsp. coracana]GJM86209.1 hypothetical protein PR202_ga02043 [Eleusine coracana subsp. coracana]
MTDLLPRDVLTDILRRVAPCGLAISRCVCKPWCNIIDTHRLLHVDLLPHLIGGIFINFHDLCLSSEFFSRPSTGPIVSGNFNYLPHASVVRDHCNGLLLLHCYAYEPATLYYVVNPTTQEDDVDLGMVDVGNLYLAFDPTLSSHFEVLLIPKASASRHRTELDPRVKGMEWPSSPYMLHVFSSRAKQWKERPFVRGDEAAGTLTNLRPG